MPPVSPRATVAIHKRARLVYTLDDYLDQGQLWRSHAEVLRKAVAERLNLVVAGGTGSGKTTFVNALLHEEVESGAPNQRFLILEDTAELQRSAPNKVQLRTCDGVDLSCGSCARRCGSGQTRSSSLRCEGGKPSTC